MARQIPNRSELAELAETHLYYEVAMLRGGQAEHAQRRAEHPNVTKLDRAEPTRIATMAYFEVVLLHGRVLNDFLAEPPRYDDDVWAGDYIAHWQPPNPGPLVRVPRVGAGLDVKPSINKQLAHFSLERLRQKSFYTGLIVREVLTDMAKFADDTTNTCYTELQGVRDLLSRTPWPTEHPPSGPPNVQGTLAGGS